MVFTCGQAVDQGFSVFVHLDGGHAALGVVPIHAILDRESKRCCELIRRLELERRAHEGLLRFGVNLGDLQRQRQIDHGEGRFRKMVAVAVHKRVRGGGGSLFLGFLGRIPTIRFVAFFIIIFVLALLCTKAGCDHLFRAYLRSDGRGNGVSDGAGLFDHGICPGGQIADDHLTLIIDGETLNAGFIRLGRLVRSVLMQNEFYKLAILILELEGRPGEQRFCYAALLFDQETSRHVGHGVLERMLLGVGAGDLKFQALQHHISRLLLFRELVFALRNELPPRFALCVCDDGISDLHDGQAIFLSTGIHSVSLGQMLGDSLRAVCAVREQREGHSFAVFIQQLEADALQGSAGSAVAFEKLKGKRRVFYGDSGGIL